MDKGCFREAPSQQAHPCWTTILLTARELALGFCHLHAKGILHCDISGGQSCPVPSLLTLTPTGAATNIALVMSLLRCHCCEQSTGRRRCRQALIPLQHANLSMHMGTHMKAEYEAQNGSQWKPRKRSSDRM